MHPVETSFFYDTKNMFRNSMKNSNPENYELSPNYNLAFARDGKIRNGDRSSTKNDAWFVTVVMLLII